MFSDFIKKYLIFFFLFSITSYSQTLSDVTRLAVPGLGSNARALGMGNAYLGISDDGSAAFFNPAGFGLIKRLEFSTGIDYYQTKNDVTFFGNKTNYDNSSTKLNKLSFVFPFPTLRGSLVFGLSYHSTKDFTEGYTFSGFNNGNNSYIQHLIDYSEIPYWLYLTDSTGWNTIINGRLNQSGTILSTGSTEYWTLSGAVEVYKNLFVGMNLNIHSGNYNKIHDYFEDDTQNIYTARTDPADSRTANFKTFSYSRILDWDISGWSANIGMLYQHEFTRFGLKIDLPKTYNIKETYSQSGYSEFGTGFSPTLSKQDYPDEKVEYNIITPFTISGGFSFNYKGLITAVDASFSDYSQSKFENVKGLSGGYVASLNKNNKESFRAVLNYNFGIEYNIPQTPLRIRGGYMVQPSPYKNDPSEFDRKYITGGGGFLVDETIAVDIAYVYGYWKDFGDNYSSNVSRTFQDIKTNRFILAFSYRF